jgi:hypothetical protein
MRRTVLLLAVLSGLAACAVDSAAPARMSASELHQYCANQMYARRIGHGRGAPSWTVYDYCVRQHQPSGSQHARVDS